MAGAEAAVHHMVVERPEVPERLIKGSKFVKWYKSDGDVSYFVISLVFDPLCAVSLNLF